MTLSLLERMRVHAKALRDSALGTAVGDDLTDRNTEAVYTLVKAAVELAKDSGITVPIVAECGAAKITLDPQPVHSYGINEIKAAFWAEFHEMGEVYFPSSDAYNSPEDCEGTTNERWRTFLEHLTKST